VMGDRVTGRQGVRKSDFQSLRHHLLDPAV
jgi:hypothetical protein